MERLHVESFAKGNVRPLIGQNRASAWLGRVLACSPKRRLCVRMQVRSFCFSPPRPRWECLLGYCRARVGLGRVGVCLLLVFV